jgi:hypothetical protein
MIAISVAFALIVLGGATCPFSFPPPDTNESQTDPPPIYNNTTDPTNDGATYIGSAACISCHQETDPDLVAKHAIHGHAFKLNRIEGAAPTYPAEGTRAGVPNPPAGFAYTNVAYVIGGYIRKARFVNASGFILTNDADGVDTQWNLTFPPTGTQAGFVPYESSGNFSPANPKPYDFSCFTCHTTGAQDQDAADPRFQDNRPGMAGTFEEPGVQCEACHGPGSKHPPDRFERDLYVGTGASDCGQCHTRGDDPTVILASGGFIKHHEQWPELLASGGHASFRCIDCHDPHTSTNYDRDNAFVKECTDCHPDQTMALHAGLTFVRGDYSEVLDCESCHMPFASKSASIATATPAVVGPSGRMADMRTHIFRINPADEDFNSMFTPDGTRVSKDDTGRAAVTLDFVCLRCHNAVGNAFGLPLVAASVVAPGIHSK